MFVWSLLLYQKAQWVQQALVLVAQEHGDLTFLIATVSIKSSDLLSNTVMQAMMHLVLFPVEM